MSKFAIQLDPHAPHLPVYLGMGEDSDVNRYAIVARLSPNGKDVSVAPFTIGDLDEWMRDINAHEFRSPDAAAVNLILKGAQRDLYGARKSVQFDITDDGAIFWKGRQLVSAQSNEPGHSVAVCEVRGATESYVPSWGVPSRMTGHYTAYRMSGGAQPN